MTPGAGRDGSPPIDSSRAFTCGVGRKWWEGVWGESSLPGSYGTRVTIDDPDDADGNTLLALGEVERRYLVKVREECGFDVSAAPGGEEQGV
jgi:hypothetical protein